jgi:hypothetical protein
VLWCHCAQRACSSATSAATSRPASQAVTFPAISASMPNGWVAEGHADPLLGPGASPESDHCSPLTASFTWPEPASSARSCPALSLP